MPTVICKLFSQFKIMTIYRNTVWDGRFGTDKIVPVLVTLIRDLRNLFEQREIDLTLESRLKVKKTLVIRD